MLIPTPFVMHSGTDFCFVGMNTMAWVLVPELIPPEKYPLYSAIVSSSFALSSLLGPLIGGAISINGNWRWVFLLKYGLQTSRAHNALTDCFECASWRHDIDIDPCHHTLELSISFLTYMGHLPEIIHSRHLANRPRWRNLAAHSLGSLRNRPRGRWNYLHMV